MKCKDQLCGVLEEQRDICNYAAFQGGYQEMMYRSVMQVCFIMNMCCNFIVSFFIQGQRLGLVYTI